MKSVAAQLADIIADAIAADASLAAWITATFGADAVLTVQSGGDATKPIMEASCPCVCVMPSGGSYSVPYEPNDSSVSVRLNFAISEDTETSVLAANVKRVTFANVSTLETFATKLIDIANAASADAGQVRVEIDLATNAGFPMAEGMAEMTFLVVGYENGSAYVAATTTTTSTTTTTTT